MVSASRAIVFLLFLLAARAGTAAPLAAQARANPQTPMDSAEALYWNAYEAYGEGTLESMRRSLELWRQSAVLFQRVDDAEHLASALRAVARAHGSLGDMDSARVYNRLAADVASGKGVRLIASVPAPTLSGFGFGATLGSDGLGGGDNDLIGQAVGPDIFVRYGTSWGLEVHGGVHLSQHGIAGVPQEYNFFGAYIEPRYVLSSLSAKWAPFVGGRVGPVWEIVNESGVNFTASGYSLGGSAGVLLKVHYQIALEMGLSVNRVSFGDYSFDGELSWLQCLEPHIATGTRLPASVTACSRSRRPGQPQLLPDDSKSNITGSGVRETILHPGWSRTGIWTRFFIGFNLALTTGW